MTFSLALPNSPECLSILAGLEGEKTRKSAGLEAVDGFAELLNQLAAMPLAAQGEPAADETELQERQEIELPTGKSLPLAAFILPVLQAEGGEAQDSEASDITPVATPVATLPGAVAAPALAVTPATAGATEAAKTETAAAGPTIRLQAEPSRMAALQDAKPAQPGQTFEVRIAAAQEPRPGAIAPAVESGKARMDLPASAPVAPQLVVANKAAVATEAPTARGMSAQETPAAQPEVIKDAKPASVETRPAVAAKVDSAAPSAAQASEHKGTQSDASPESEATPQRAAVQVEAPKMQVLAGRGEDTATLPPVHSSTPRTVVTDPVAQVERVVEQLMAARQVDLTKPSAIAVAHKEFGALTVTFDPSAGGMNVEVAAEDSDAHRALAAAMASDRSAPRQQEAAAPTTSTSQQAGQASADRGSASGQSGNSFGQGSGEGQRSQNADQRGRQGDRPTSHNQPAPSSNSDDALYA